MQTIVDRMRELIALARRVCDITDPYYTKLDPDLAAAVRDLRSTIDTISAEYDVLNEKEPDA